MRAEFIAEVRAAIAARVPIIFVGTHEEQRALELLTEAVGAGRVTTWTSTNGLGDDPAILSASDAIQAPFTRDKPVRVLFDVHPFLDNPRVVRALRDFIRTVRSTGAILILVSPSPDVPAELDRDSTVIHLPLPGPEEVGALFDQEKARIEPPEGLTREAFVRAALGLTQGEVYRAYRLAAMMPDAESALARIVAEKQSTLRKSSTLELISADIALEDVGGLEVLKAWLKMRVLAFDEGARAFGLAQPRGMLVCGVQGCGKSLVSKAAARVLGLPLVRLDFADVFAMPSPEQALREAMRVVEAISPVVLWVDEVEKGLGEGTSDARQARVFGAFLTWLQERRAMVFVAATANDVERLPPELSRRGRFDEIFFVDLPSIKERQDILRLQLKRRGRDPAAFAVDALGESLEHFSGAELEQVVTSGLFRAYAKRRELTDLDLRAAAKETTPLAVLYEEKIQALRTWGRARARRASADRRTLELFED